ncbi:MAG TPA: hypothetical protein VH092_38775, partial [Urbifossiella sp.]|nr:hypothetical protein [Urbifossiella sp.]
VRAADPPADLAVPPEQVSKARDLVRQLGNPSYQVREDATAELGKMGRQARQALLEAVAASSDHEVRARAARLLPRAEAADLQARIDAFVADADGRFQHDLPGWDQFRELTGADKQSRALFADMLRGPENREVLTAVAGSRRDGGAAVGNRRLALYLGQNPGAFGMRIGGSMPQPKQPVLADVATVLFAEGVIPAADIPRSGPFTFITGAFFAQQQVSVSAATNPAGTPNGEAYKRLLLRWLDTRTSPDDLGQVVNVAQQLGQLRDMTPLLRKVVTTDGVQGHARGQAMVFLLQRNKKAEHPFLKAQLKNEAVVTPVFLGANPMGGAIQADCQVRDMVLALLVADAGQSIHEYGFQTAPGNTPNPLTNPFPTYAFTTDEARTRAMRKWAEWEARHPAPAPEPKK